MEFRLNEARPGNRETETVNQKDRNPETKGQKWKWAAKPEERGRVMG